MGLWCGVSLLLLVLCKCRINADHCCGIGVDRGYITGVLEGDDESELSESGNLDDLLGDASLLGRFSTPEVTPQSADAEISVEADRSDSLGRKEDVNAIFSFASLPVDEHDDTQDNGFLKRFVKTQVRNDAVSMLD